MGVHRLPSYAIAEGFCAGVIPAPAACTVRDLYVIWSPEPPRSAMFAQPAVEPDNLCQDWPL